MSEKVKTCGSNFRKVITMIKHWNKIHSSYLQSYHIEAMALNIFDNTMNDITWEILKFFDEAQNLIDSPFWYEGSYVDAYLSYNNKQEVKKRLATAYEKAREAWHNTYGDNDDHQSAINIWRQIFGDKYPQYG